MSAGRRVRGVLFTDYVRMIRREWRDWRSHVTADERAVLESRIQPDDWYSMELFERLGLHILANVVGQETDSIRLWGRTQVQNILAFVPDVASAGDPRESVMRFSNFFASFFDFPALQLDAVDDSDALVVVDYGMSPPAEEAATWQTVGFFEELLAASGGRSVRATLASATWQGAAQTRVALSWESRLAPSPKPLLAKPRVLLVDDEPLVARGITRLLGSRAELTSVTSAADALRLLETREFDAVVSDYVMPERDGLSLLEEIARRWPAVRRVLHTGSMPREAAAALASGVVHQLVDKPAAADTLMAAVGSR